MASVVTSLLDPTISKIWNVGVKNIPASEGAASVSLIFASSLAGAASILKRLSPDKRSTFLDENNKLTAQGRLIVSTAASVAAFAGVEFLKPPFAKALSAHPEAGAFAMVGAAIYLYSYAKHRGLFKKDPPSGPKL